VNKHHVSTKNVLLALFLVFIFLHGCIKIETYEQFYPNGRSKITSQVYIKNLVDTLDASKITPPNNQTWADYFNYKCNSLESSSNTDICAIRPDWFIFSQDRISGDGFAMLTYDDFPYTNYELIIFEPPILPLGEFREIGQYKVPSKLLFSKFNQTLYDQMTSSGVQYSYVAVLPAEVIESSHGTFEKNVVKLDILEVIRLGFPVKIVARELNLLHVGVLTFGVIILLSLLLSSIYWFLKEWSVRRDSNLEIKKKKELEEEQKRIFRKDSRLKQNQVYMAPGDLQNKPKSKSK
jgi:hypothetical protein